MEIHTLGIDLGKTLFHLVGVDSSGRVVVRKRCSRSQLLVQCGMQINDYAAWRGRA